jgi:hypothetical protein
MKSGLCAITVFLLTASSCGGTGVETSLETKPEPAPDVIGEGTIHIEVQEVAPVSDAIDLRGDLPDGAPDVPHCLEKPFELFCPCQSDAECASGYCIQVPAGAGGGKVCTMSCLEDCPEGWQCALVAGSCPDCSYVCIPWGAMLCHPCKNHSDCGDPMVESPDLCVFYGPQGRFCGADCGGGKACPDGYVCQNVQLEGGAAATQCVLESGECECTQEDVAVGASTVCFHADPVGNKCFGLRVCTADGLSECDAQEPVQEACNGVDDDCNGVADDGIAPVECSKSNEHGTCKGTELCAGGTAVCDAPEPAAELCDGKDNDCDGQVDEDSKDTDLDGLANCVDEDDDGDGVPDDADLCPLVQDPGQEDHDLDTVGDACDPDDDNDQFPDAGDCGPLDKNVFPGAIETCNGKDDDCDGWTDESTCNDDNPCTDDVCNPAEGCQFPANGLACEDGDPCTSGDKCSDGKCAGGVNVCPCKKDEDCPGLGFVGGCVGKLYCDTSAIPHGCKVDPAGATPCPAPTSQCVTVTCNVATGQCDGGNVPDQTPCDDKDACTMFDRCESGECVPGPAISCDDGNLCTDDSCNPKKGCGHQANQLPCDDGNACTLEDACSAGWCTSKLLLKCDDGNLCTDDVCDPLVGCIANVNTNLCSDGNACTTGDQCKNGVCQAGMGLPCDDGNLCTTDECVDPILGTCIHEEKDCKDGNCCTTDSCDPKTGQCKHVACDCDDHDPCTDDIQLGCPDNGTPIQCKNVPKSCDDKNLCTIDACDKISGQCENTPVDCNDANKCTQDSCNPATGLCLHVAKSSDDLNPCTEDSCDWQTGNPVHVLKSCDDGDACTLDYCDPVTGLCLHPAKDCDDGNKCTVDSCGLPEGKCVFAAKCDDADACTQDSCEAASGDCANAVVDCDDGNGCTDDSCDPQDGCLNTPNTVPCDDGNPCNGQDTCGGGTCQPGTGPSCDDGDSCTDDGCLGGVCTHTANLAAQGCSDWVFTPNVSCLGGSAPALDEAGTLWAIGTATPCDQGDAYNNDRIVGVDSLSGAQVSIFTIASPASQPVYRQQRITLSLDWNWNSTCGGCQIGYNLPGGGIAWQGGQGPHPRGGISMSADGTMYSSYNSILAIGWNGSTVWSASGNSGSQGAGSWIMGDGGIIGCTNGGTCRKVSSGGASQWQQSLGCNGPQLATDSQGSVIASCWDSGVRAYPAGGGNAVWVVDPTPNVSAPLVASQDRVIVGTSDGHVLVLSASGTTLGDHAVCGAAQLTPWMITSDNRVWGVCGNAKVVAVGLDGSNLYTLSTGKNANWVALAKDGAPLVSVGASVYRLKKGAVTLATAPWPTVDHDLQRTRNGKP